MPPKRVGVPAPSQKPRDQSYVGAVLSEVSNPENRTVLTALGMFAAGVAFLHSSWSEFILPPV